MRKKISEQVRILFEKGRLEQHRGMVVIIGDRAKDQVINLYNLWLTIRQSSDKAGSPRILWCYKDDLGFSSHQKRRRKEISKAVRQGLYESESENPFELFLTSADIRYCYYKDTQSILGNTFEVLILQDFEGITANILCRTMETVAGGGIVFLMLKSMHNLRQLYTMAMDVHNRYRTDAFSDVQPLFNERLMLSLASSDGVLFLDDELNLLPLSSHHETNQNLRKVDEGDTEEIEESDIVRSLRVATKNLNDVIEGLRPNKTIHGLVSLTKTIDQAKAVLGLLDSIVNRDAKSSNQGAPNKIERHETVFLTSGRGRGKSSALGLAIAGALAYQVGSIAITAATPENLKTVFDFIANGLEALGLKKNLDYTIQLDADNNPKNLTLFTTVENIQAKERPISTMDVDSNPGFIKSNVQDGDKTFRVIKQQVSYVSPETRNLNCNLLVIDEAAAIPITHVKPLVMTSACPVFISSTVHGYEGSGRSLSLKLVDELRKQSAGSSGRYLREIEMTIPIRYGLGDPIENWLNTFLCLDSTNAVPLKSTLPHPRDCKLYFVQKTTLFSFNKSSEKFLKSIWSLFVSSHYKNSPNDLQLLSDAPAHALCVLLGPIDSTSGKAEIPDVLVAIQLCFEGGIKRATVDHNSSRGSRPAGDLVPWALAEQFLDKKVFDAMGARIVRIATHPKAVKLGYGSRAIELLEQFLLKNFIEKKDLLSFDDFTFNIANNEQTIEVANLNQQLAPRKRLPPLLKNVEDLRPPQMHYLSVSYGLTKDLFRFWDKNGFRAVYIRQSKNEITGENTNIMIKGLTNDLLNFGFFFQEFKKRFVSLLASEFRDLDLFVSLHMLQPNLTTNTNEEEFEAEENKANNKIFEVLFSEFDLARLEAYSQNTVEHYMIKDLLPRIAELFFLNYFSFDVKLSLSQAAILLGFGLQKKSLEELTSVLRIDHSQVLALYNKAIKRLTNQIKEKIESATAKEIGFNDEKGDNQNRTFEPLKSDADNLIGNLVNKKRENFPDKAIHSDSKNGSNKKIKNQ